MNKNISFVVFTFNEEKRIEYIIKNFIAYGEVLIMDDGSTDRTKEISERLGATYILRPKTKSITVENQEMFDFVKKTAKNDWIYWGMSDQMMPKKLLDKLAELSDQARYKYVYLPFYTYLWGDTKNAMLKGSYPLFFRKECVDFSKNKIHGLGRFTGGPSEILWLPDEEDYAIRHYSLYDLHKFITGHLNYAELEATQKFESGERFSLCRLFGGMARYFFMYYKRAYRSGMRGLIVSLVNMFFRGMVYIKLYELENGITLDTIEASFREDKMNILENLK